MKPQDFGSEVVCSLMDDTQVPAETPIASPTTLLAKTLRSQRLAVRQVSTTPTVRSTLAATIATLTLMKPARQETNVSQQRGAL